MIPRAARIALLAAFASQFVILDLALRGTRSFAHHPAFVACAIQSVALWGLLAWASRHWAVRVVVALFAAALLVLQAGFYRRFGSWVDVEVIRSTIRFWADVKPNLGAYLPGLALSCAVAAVIEFLWMHAAFAGRPSR
jgi:hypothetical protein